MDADQPLIGEAKIDQPLDRPSAEHGEAELHLLAVARGMDLKTGLEAPRERLRLLKIVLREPEQVLRGDGGVEET